MVIKDYLEKILFQKFYDTCQKPQQICSTLTFNRHIMLLQRHLHMAHLANHNAVSIKIPLPNS